MVKAFIGMGAILLSYSRIGSQCIVAVGTLVTQRKVIPDKSMVYGNPFQIVCSLRQNEINGVYHDVLEYRDLDRDIKSCKK